MNIKIIISVLLFCILTSCSINSIDNHSTSNWEIDPILQLFSNPIVELSVFDSKLIVVTGNHTSILDNYPDSNRTGITLRNNSLVNHLHNPISSVRCIYYFSNNSSSEIFVDGYQDEENSFSGRGTLNIRQFDSTNASGFSIYSSIPLRNIGAVSEDDYLLLASINENAPYDSCGDENELMIIHTEIDTSFWGNNDHPNFSLVTRLPFNVEELNSIKYFDQHFFVTTSNGFLKMDKNGKNQQWFLHLSTDCSVLFKTKAENEFRLNDSLYELWSNSGTRHSILDVISVGDSLFAFQANGDILISGDNGNTWPVNVNTNFNNRTKLIKTESLFLATFGSQIFQIDIESNEVIEINTSNINNLLINDIAEYKGRLYLATDGGLYSKPISKI